MNKSESRSILPHLKKHLHTTLPDNPFLIIGVSGGADSMALLYALYKMELRALAVHINYGQRGEESDADQDLVEQISAMWGFECCSIRLNSKSVSGNFQDWARNERYTVFEELRKVYEADAIAVAHNQDDQLETVLFKLLRGSGFPKLAGLKEWDKERKILRPLLEVSKQEILDYCKAEHIPYRTDTSNLENKYARNAIRNEVLPVFEEFIPGWKENLIEISKSAAAFEESLNELLKNCATKDTISVLALASYSDSLKGSLLKKFVESKTEATLSKGQIEHLLILVDAETGKFVELEQGIRVIKDRDVLILQRIELSADENASIIINENEALNGVSFQNRRFTLTKERLGSGLYVDGDTIQWPIICRKWEAGDSFVPLGMTGSQKISDHLTNRKIKSANRQESLILRDSGGTICAILYPEPLKNGQIGNIAETNKGTELTTRYFCIEKL